MSLIKREDLIDHLNACLSESDGETPITDAVLVAIRSAVEQMPEVDAVPVVRCKDCFFAMPVENREPKYRCINICRDGCKQLVGSDDYCSYGDRTENVCVERRGEDATD